MSNLKIGNALVAALVAAVVALGIGFLHSPAAPSGALVEAGAPGQLVGATPATLYTTVFSHLTNLEVNQNLGVVGTFFQGADANSSTSTLQTNVSLIPCPTGSSASSTLFAVQPPSGATSTVSMISITGTQGATTTDIVIATSTVASPPLTTTTATSSLNANIINLAAIANGTFFRSIAGVLIGSGKGYSNPKGIPSSLSFQMFDVGPNDYLVGFSTSTAVAGAGGRAAAQVAVPASCMIKIEWQN